MKIGQEVYFVADEQENRGGYRGMCHSYFSVWTAYVIAADEETVCVGPDVRFIPSSSVFMDRESADAYQDALFKYWDLQTEEGKEYRKNNPEVSTARTIEIEPAKKLYVREES